jgi:uncharacterized membrane protein YdbT with pleckstrin-like domain
MVDLEQNEKIITTARRHWFVLLARLVPFVLLAIIPVFLIIVVEIMGAAYPDSIITVSQAFFKHSGSGSAFVIFLLFSWLLFLWVGAFVTWTDYFLDVLVITDHRVINIEQKGLFSRETSSLHLDKIQDVTIDVSGILPTFLSFGNMRVQTAGEMEEFSIHAIRNPEKLKAIILEAHEKAEAKNREVTIAKS